MPHVNNLKHPLSPSNGSQFDAGYFFPFPPVLEVKEAFPSSIKQKSLTKY
jgi:hypothetical protein